MGTIKCAPTNLRMRDALRSEVLEERSNRSNFVGPNIFKE